MHAIMFGDGKENVAYCEVTYAFISCFHKKSFICIFANNHRKEDRGLGLSFYAPITVYIARVVSFLC
jgi:hypothetical protein